LPSRSIVLSGLSASAWRSLNKPKLFRPPLFGRFRRRVGFVWHIETIFAFYSLIGKWNSQWLFFEENVPWHRASCPLML
jgi:hypothetical protein